MKRINILLFTIVLLVASCKKNPTNVAPPEVVPPVIVLPQSGLITTSSDFPTSEESFTITFDASKGNGGLKGFSGDVYMHTGVITDKSTSASDWKYVKSTSFNTADPAVKMTVSGNGVYKFTLSPRSFYNVPAGEKILKLAMVFRSADGNTVGKNIDQSDIYLPLYDAGKLNIRFKTPEFEPTYTPVPVVSIKLIGEELSVSATASKTANLTLTINGTSFAAAANTTQITGIAKNMAAGNQTIKVTASNGAEVAESAFSFFINNTVQVAELPAGAKEGVVFINGGKSAILTLYAPAKQYVYAIGDFNAYQQSIAYAMKKTPDGNRWWVQVDNLDASKTYTYQYLVDGNLKIADPYCEEVLDPQNDSYIPPLNFPAITPYPTGKTTGIVSVMQANPATYTWKNNGFNRPEKNNLVIYELHLRDFLSNANYTALLDKLDYLKNLGINAIELMPVTEFEGNLSWGYNPSFYFAPDKYYGNKVSLQKFIDEAHGKGIAVIMDMVLNHSFGQSPMVQLYFDQATGKPTANSPWFNATPTHPYNVGYDFNHESAATKTFVKNVLKFWMDNYKIDGFRFDLSKGFTQKNSGTSDNAVGAWSAYDASRIAIWKEYNNFIKSNDPNNFYVILEHFAADAEEKELAEEGMMMWNNLNANFNQSTMGYMDNSDFSRAFYGTHGFAKSENLVTYMESHDEERLMFKNLTYGNSNTSKSYSIKELATALQRQKMAAAFLMAIPGPKMIWQFGELGYDISIEQNGRTGEKPIHWDYFSQPQRKALYDAFSKYIKLKTTNSIFKATNISYDLNSFVKHVKLTDISNTVIVVGNFDVNDQAVSLDFGASGTWYDAVNGQTINLSASIFSKTLAPGEYHIFSKKQFN